MCLLDVGGNNTNVQMLSSVSNPRLLCNGLIEPQSHRLTIIPTTHHFTSPPVCHPPQRVSQARMRDPSPRHQQYSSPNPSSSPSVSPIPIRLKGSPYRNKVPSHLHVMHHRCPPLQGRGGDQFVFGHGGGMAPNHKCGITSTHASQLETVVSWSHPYLDRWLATTFGSTPQVSTKRGTNYYGSCVVHLGTSTIASILEVDAEAVMHTKMYLSYRGFAGWEP